MQQGTARHRIGLARHVAAVLPNTPTPPSPAPGEPWSSPRVFPQPGPSLAGLGTQPFLHKRKRGSMRSERATNTNTQGWGNIYNAGTSPNRCFVLF